MRSKNLWVESKFSSYFRRQMRVKLILLSIFIAGISCAQDISASRKIVDTLTSSYFWGRGYTNNGASKAAKFLESQFQSYGLVPVADDSFRQHFSYPVNTFPGKMKLSINGIPLSPGKDFIVSPESRGLKARAKLVQKDSANFINNESRILLSLSTKLTWSVSQQVADYTSIFVDKRSLKDIPQIIEIDIENQLIDNFKTANICGIVKGTTLPDSIIMITAHYDHLGGMGRETYFPGANDNASGVALLLKLAKYYAQNPAKYSMAFICFSGEEAGLVGSKYFSENPLVDLKKIRFLVNTDLAGTGEEGITVVNSTVFKSEFELLNKVNDKGNYLPKIFPRGKAANSDHHWFTEKGVPSFFIYTMGGIKAYHNIYDKSETLPLNEHEDLFRLIVGFNKELM